MITAKLNNYRQAPRKVRLVTDLIRGKNVVAALNHLMFVPKKASAPIKKLLDSAIANAVHNFNIQPENLFVKEISVNQGPIMKRSMPRARGRAFPIHKHTSHVNLVLAEKGVTAPKKAAKAKVAKKEVKAKKQ